MDHAPRIRRFRTRAINLGFCAPRRDGLPTTRPSWCRRRREGLGDFAVAAALSLPYALAARAQADLSTDDGAATRSAVCLTGWFTAQWFGGAFSLDSAGGVPQSRRRRRGGAAPAPPTASRTHVFPDVPATGFELVGAFRLGFLEGGGACDIGL